MGRHSLFHRLISVLITLSLLASAFLASFSPAIADDKPERIPVGPELTAVLTTDGVLTLEGSGPSYDYDLGDSPLTAYADRITQLVIPKGVTALGNYLFYGCYRLTGTLTLPDGLLELGDGAFSGPEAAKAPHFTYIFNDFTFCEEVVPAEDPAATQDPEPAESAEPAGTTEPVGDTDPAQNGAPPAEPAVTESGDPAQSMEPSQSAGPGETAQPAGSDAPPAESMPTESADLTESTAPSQDAEPSRSVQPPAETGDTEIIGEEKVPLAPEDALDPAPDTEPSVRQEPEAGLPPDPETDPAPEAEPSVTELPEAPSPASPEEDASPASPEGSDPQAPEPSEENGPAPEPAPAPAPEATTLPQKDYRVEPRYEQTVGREVFYPAADGERSGLFLCTMENLSFLNAAVEGGYVLADGALTLYLVPGQGEGKVASHRVLAFEGRVTAPACPEGFTPLTGEGEFLGWLTGEGEELYAPGDSFPVDLETGEAVLSALWSDSFATLEETPPPAVTFSAGLGTGKENMLNRSESVICEDGKQTYARWPEDLGFSAPGKKTDESGRDHFLDEAGNKVEAPTGLGTGYAAAIVFDGWAGSDGNAYDPGDRVDAGVTLTAKWAWAVVGYMSQIGKSGRQYYLSAAMNSLIGRSQMTTDKYRNIIVIDQEAQLHECGNLLGQTDDKLPDLACTVTGKDPVGSATGQTLSMDSYVADSGYKFTRLTAPMIMCDIALKASHSDEVRTHWAVGDQLYLDGFYANCNKLIMGKGITMAKVSAGWWGEEKDSTLNIFGGAGGGREATETDGSAYLTVFSGRYLRLYGGSFLVSMKGGNRYLNFLGGETDYLYGGGYQKGNTTTGLSDVYMAGGTVHNDLAASSDLGQVTGDARFTMVGGTVMGNVYGGVYGEANNDFCKMNGNTTVTIRTGTVGGSVYGGGNISPLTGDTAVEISGGSVGQAAVLTSGNLFGGGNEAAVTGNTAVTVSGGTVLRSVYGGGNKAPVTGPTVNDAVTPATVKVNVTGGVIDQDIYGGGDQAAVSGNTVIAVTGGTVGRNSTSGNIYGGGNSGALTGDAAIDIQSGAVRGSVFGGGSQAALTGNVSVTISGPNAKVSGHVYGGGNEGTVTAGTVEVTVSNGAVVGPLPLGGNVYGGGQGGTATVSGPTVNGAATPAAVTVTVDGGAVSGSVYGGGSKAAVTGSIRVKISGPDTDAAVVSGSVYGGGLSSTASVTGNTAVTVSGGMVSGSVYGGGQEASVLNSDEENGTTAVKLSGGQVAGSIYGGGKGLSDKDDTTAAVARSATVAITGGTVGKESSDGSVENGNVYGGGSEGTIGMEGISAASAAVHISGGRILGSVYGGGYCGKVGLGTVNTNEAQMDSIDVPGSTFVTVSDDSSIGGDVFGGGEGIDTGAGLGAVFGNSSVTITGGSVGRRVFGGSNMARIAGDATVYVTSETGPVTIQQTIYAGCNGQGTTFNMEKYLVFGDSTVYVEQTKDPVVIGGSIFGSGNLTRVNGIRTLTIKNITGEIDSLQRAHTVKIINCELTLTGASDKVDGTSLDFSIARVPGEVKLINSNLTARTELNEVANFGSYEADETTPDNSGQNALTILAGKLLSFGTTTTEGDGRATQIFQYGKVSGVTTLRWAGDEGDTYDSGVFVHANLDSATQGTDAGGNATTGAFIADPGQEKEIGKKLRADKTGSYSFWQLGGNTVKTRVVFQLQDSTKNEKGYYEDTVTFPLPISVDQGTAFVPVDPRLDQYTPILTEDGDQILTLEVRQDNQGDALWDDYYHSVKIVNKPHGDGTVDASEGQLVFEHEEAHYPVTSVTGLPQFDLTLAYKDQFVAGGTVYFTLLAHAADEDPTSDSRGRFTVEVVIQGQGRGTSKGRAKAGRQYNRFYSSETPTPTIGTKDAVTVQTVLNYTPVLSEGEVEPALFPVLSVRDSTTGNAVDAQVRVLMADLSFPSAPKWYIGTMANGTIRADQLINVRGEGDWKPPTQGQAVVDKNLLIILDFRDSGLGEGEYYFSLEFPTGSCATCDVPFLMVDPVEKGSLSWSETGTTLTVTTPGDDVNYADGTLVRLTGLSQSEAGKVKAACSDGGIDLITGDGAVFLRLPGLTQGKTATVSWTFPDMRENTAVKAELFPLPHFQSGSLGTADVWAEKVLTASGEGETLASERAMVVTLTAGDRLVDSAAGTDVALTFRIAPDQSLAAEEGERVTVTKLLKKTKTDPGDGSYTLAVDGWTYTPQEGDALAGTLELPAGLGKGTYRICFELQRGEGDSAVTLARYPFNIIVY